MRPYRDSARPPIPPPKEEHSRFVRPLKRLVGGAVLLVAVIAGAMILRSDNRKTNEHWTFVDAATPADLGLVAQGTGGVWALEDYEPATGGRALANHEGKAGGDPALLIATELRARDIRARTRCKVVGTTDARIDGDGDGIPLQVRAACGVLFRFVDARNYWVVRINAGSSDVEAVAIVRGVPRVVKRAPSEVISMDTWTDLEVEARGDIIRVAFAGQPLFVAEAPGVPAAFGAAGLWAPAEAKVFFDHFTIETLTPAPQALEILPLLGRRQG